jgi:4-hydroxy-tetrahydrodipicolinate reductase
MNIGLIGHGKMGKAIERIALQRNHIVAWRIGSKDIALLQNIDPESIDVAIEFTQPEAAYHNVYTCLQQGIPVICGTTGWAESKPAIELYCQEQGGTFFYATNFSLAMQLFFRLNELLAQYMDPHPEFEVMLEETHDITKKDQPSGTAIQLAEDIIKNLNRKTSWTNTSTTGLNQLPIISHRIPHSMGTHVVQYISPLEELSIKHVIKNRDSLAQGVILVAEWIQGKKGVLGMKDFLGF